MSDVINYYEGDELAGEAIEPGRFVTIDSGTIIAADDTTVRPIGVNLFAVASGEKPVVAGPGMVVVVDIKAAETISASNTPVGCDTGGKATATIADGKYAAAVSVDAGSAAGGRLRVRVIEPYTASVP